MMIGDKYPWLMELNIVTVLIRTVVAILCGGLIGYERNRMGADAGMRTHSLVAVGSMLAMMTGVFAVTHYSGDVSRIGAQVISGIGFLGAGTIMVRRDNHVSGLTTAAGLWASACIGLAIGTGFYEGAIVGTVVVYLIERELRRFSKKYARSLRDEDNNDSSEPQNVVDKQNTGDSSQDKK